MCVRARSLAYPAFRLPSGSDVPSEIFQTPVFFYFVLPPRPASPQPCQVQCGNDKHPLYPSSEVPAALSHRRGSHIFKLSAAPSPGRINLELHKANVSSGHVNEARCTRRLGEKGRSRGRTKREASWQKVGMRSRQSDRQTDRQKHPLLLRTHTCKACFEYL